MMYSVARFQTDGVAKEFVYIARKQKLNHNSHYFTKCLFDKNTLQISGGVGKLMYLEGHSSLQNPLDPPPAKPWPDCVFNDGTHCGQSVQKNAQKSSKLPLFDPQANINWEQAGVHIIFGARRSGKTTMLQRILNASPCRYTTYYKSDNSLEQHQINGSHNIVFDDYYDSKTKLIQKFMNSLQQGATYHLFILSQDFGSEIYDDKLQHYFYYIRPTLDNSMALDAMKNTLHKMPCTHEYCDKVINDWRTNSEYNKYECVAFICRDKKEECYQVFPSPNITQCV